MNVLLKLFYKIQRHMNTNAPPTSSENAHAYRPRCFVGLGFFLFVLNSTSLSAWTNKTWMPQIPKMLINHPIIYLKHMCLSYDIACPVQSVTRILHRLVHSETELAHSLLTSVGGFSLFS